MSNHVQIKELQEKAFNGDTEALELYNEYVNKGEAPAIHVKQATTNVGDMYKYANEVSKPSMYGDRETRERTGHSLSAIEKMMMGYAPMKECEE